MMYHHTKFKLPCAFHEKYMNVQICIMSTFVPINIVYLFPSNQYQKLKNHNFDKIGKTGKGVSLFAKYTAFCTF